MKSRDGDLMSATSAAAFNLTYKNINNKYYAGKSGLVQYNIDVNSLDDSLVISLKRFQFLHNDLSSNV